MFLIDIHIIFVDWKDVITFSLESKTIPFLFLSILIYLTLIVEVPQLGQKTSFAVFIPREGKGLLEIQRCIRP